MREHNIQKIIIENSESIKSSTMPLELIKHLLGDIDGIIITNEWIESKYVLSIPIPNFNSINIFLDK